MTPPWRAIRSGEIPLDKGFGLLEESVRLVGIGEVCGSADHIGNLLGKDSETGGGSAAGRIVVFLDAFAPVDFRRLSREPFLKPCGLDGREPPEKTRRKCRVSVYKCVRRRSL